MSNIFGRECVDAATYLGQREVLALELPNEVEAIEVLGAIVGARSPRLGLWKEPLLDVIAHGARTDVGARAELSEVERGVIGHAEQCDSGTSHCQVQVT